MDYGRRKNLKRHKKIISKAVMQRKRIGIRMFKAFLLCAVVLIIAGCAGGFWFLKKIIDDSPVISPNDVKPSGYITSVYADDKTTKTEELVASGANRVYKALSEIPADLQHAFVAIEDERFYAHEGIDMRGIARAGVTGALSGNFDEGASTITQQLLKNSIFNFMSENTFFDKVERKLQEQYLAIQLEKLMSKDDILENYLNMINLGQNTLGVEAAAQRYFGKSVTDLTLSESAVIAGITQSPTYLNPIEYPEDNAKRREKVLGDMLKQGYITQTQYDEALADDVYVRIQAVNESLAPNSPYSYFNDALAEQILKDLVKAGYTETQAFNKLYCGGLTIYSTQNLWLQQVCDEEVNSDYNYVSDITWGISYALTVTRADGSTENYGSAQIRAYALAMYGDDQGLLYGSQERCYEMIEEWKATIAKEGDTYNERVTLSPQPQSSVTLLDQYTGQIKALVGGRGAKTSSMSLNRAYTGSTRQPGSLFKVLATYAPALDTDQMSLATTIVDEPYNYSNGTALKNWYSGYRGTVTVRTAIEQSMNICAVKALTEITPDLGYEYCQKLGLSTMVPTDIVQALALGGITRGVYNYEITAAFAAIANNGMYNEPILYTQILDHDGSVLLENKGQNSRQALRPSTAGLLTSAMQDVINKGTGMEARLPNMPVAGKTGTTSSDRDVWLCAYTPYYTCGVWLGYDENLSMTGMWLSHMQLWRNIMRRVHEGLEYKDFDMPEDAEQITICSATGKIAVGSCSGRTEYFAASMIPTEYCGGHIVEPDPEENPAGEEGETNKDVENDAGGGEAEEGAAPPEDTIPPSP